MKDIIVGITSLLLGVFIIMMCRDLPIFIARGYPGPSFFPLILSSLSLLCGLILMIRSYRNMRISKERDRSKQNIKYLEDAFKSLPVKNAIKYIISAAVYILLIPYIGFFLTSLMFMFLVQIIYEVPVLKALAVSFAAMFFIYLLFIVVLKVVVPEPILGMLIYR